MTVENMATVFGPNFLSPREVVSCVSSLLDPHQQRGDDVQSLVQATTTVHTVTCALIENSETIFELMADVWSSAASRC